MKCKFWLCLVLLNPVNSKFYQARFSMTTHLSLTIPLSYHFWASLVAQLVKNLPAIGRPGSDLWVGKIPWGRERLPTPVFWPGEFHGLYSPWGLKESPEPLSILPLLLPFFNLMCWWNWSAWSLPECFVIFLASMPSPIIFLCFPSRGNFD